MTGYKDKRIMKNKTVWTMSNLNRYQEQKNYRMCDPEYFGIAKPTFELFDLDQALKFIPIYQDINNHGKLRRAMAWFKDVPFLERGTKRSKM